MSPWIWQRLLRVVHVERLPDGRTLIRRREPTHDEAKAEAEHRQQTARAAETIPLVSTVESGQAKWKRAVLEHEVERRAQAEGRGGFDDEAARAAGGETSGS